MLPDVRGGEGRDGGEDVVPEGLQVQGDVRELGRERGVREDGIEHRVFSEAGAAVGEDGGEGVGVEGRWLRWRRHGEARGNGFFLPAVGGVLAFNRVLIKFPFFGPIYSTRSGKVRGSETWRYDFPVHAGLFFQFIHHFIFMILMNLNNFHSKKNQFGEK